MARRKLIVPPGMGAPVERFGYAPGVLVDDTLYVSGQVGRDEQLRVIEDPSAQIDQAFRNVGKVLDTAGFQWSDVVELETWLLHFQRDLPLVLQIKPRFLGRTVTTWTGFGVAEFSMPGLLFEAKVTAVRGSS
jgi:enamine deaminase RidA (YjgF/YER057c/UK114 family)